MTTLNLRSERKICRDDCPGTSIERGYYDKGDVVRCRHGHLFAARYDLGWHQHWDTWRWTRLSPFWTPFRYRRAVTLLSATHEAGS